MNIQEFYTSVGGSYENVLSRIPSEAMIIKFIKKFPGDPSYAEIKKAVADGDAKSAFLASHTLKGVASNLGFGELAKTASELTELLRGQIEMPCVDELVSNVDTAYQTVIEKLATVE